MLRNIKNSQGKFYRTFKIPKRNEGVRVIKEPYPSLKEIQKWILDNILRKVPVSRFAKAYVSQRNIIDNAKFHCNQKIVMKFDVKDFFGSISQDQIIKLFEKLGYTRDLSSILAGLCCLDDGLPQGAPTSPYLSNIFAKEIDDALFSYLRTDGLYYTRYSDDITISGNIEERKIPEIMSYCNRLLGQYGLSLNRGKTKVLRPQHKHFVTGIVVNKKVSADRKLKRELRQQLYYIKKYGIESHILHEGIRQERYLYHLMGKVQWVLFLEPQNKEFLEYCKILKDEV